MKEIIVAKGIFSKLTIQLQDGVDNQLALITKEANPLASVEEKLKSIIDEFEEAYFRAVKNPTPVEETE